MPWAKFGDGFRRDKRVLPLSHPAWRLYVCSHLEAVVLMRDGDRAGLLTRHQAEAVARAERVPLRAIREVVEAGLWQEGPEGYEIYKFEKFLPSRRELAAERGAPDPVKAAAGRAGVAARRQQTGSKAVVTRKQSGSPGRRQQTGSPVPEPVPEGSTEISVPHGTSLSPARGSAAERVWAVWLESTGRTSRTQYDGKRKARVVWALKHYPVEDVEDACRGWINSPHHRGENDRGTVYNDVELLLRDAKHLEFFRDLWRGGAAQMPANDVDRQVMRLAAESSR